MATVLSISNTVNIGRTSTYLSLNYVGKQVLFGGSVIRPTPPSLIGMATDALEWGIGVQSDDSLRITANYLYWLCGKFQLQAQNIIFGPGGGSVIPTPSGGAGTLNDLDFVVSASSIIPTGGSTIMLDGQGGRPDFRGYNINFARNGTVQYTTSPPFEATYYSWNKTTGEFSLLTNSVNFSAAALVDEQFRITADLGNVSASIPSSVESSVTVTAGVWEPDGVTLNLPYIVNSGEVTLFVSGYTGNFLVAPTNFVYTATGIQMIDPGFDAANFPFTLIMKIN